MHIGDTQGHGLLSLVYDTDQELHQDCFIRCYSGGHTH